MHVFRILGLFILRSGKSSVFRSKTPKNMVKYSDGEGFWQRHHASVASLTEKVKEGITDNAKREDK